MPSIDLRLSVDIERTARVCQVEGMFDIEEASRSEVRLAMDVDLEHQPWTVGLIAGPSGCGKSSIARHLFGDAVIERYAWHASQAIVDGFDEHSTHDIIKVLSSVGFSSPPSWLRPYRVLSNGERFRADLARAILDDRPIIAIDEFSSVVDRKVARVGSHAVQKEVRRRGRKLVAITCHDDLVEWLQPDWILEPHTGELAWRLVQPRPKLKLTIVRTPYETWRGFAHHHYLTRKLSRSARCFLGLIDGVPVVFAGLLPYPHPKLKKHWRIHRHVVLPDYQGIGVAGAMTSTIGAICRSNGHQLIGISAHPGVIAHRMRSPNWKVLNRPYVKIGGRDGPIGAYHIKQLRRTASFRYVGPPLKPEHVAQGRMLWHAL